MSSKKRLILTIVAMVFCIVVGWLSTSVGQSRRTYETQIYTTPEYRTDAARAIDAYERTMERYIDATERNFASLRDFSGTIADRLDAIDGKLAKLDERIARIEDHLGIVPPAPPVPEPNVPTPLTIGPQLD